MILFLFHRISSWIIRTLLDSFTHERITPKRHSGNPQLAEHPESLSADRQALHEQHCTIRDSGVVVPPPQNDDRKNHNQFDSVIYPWVNDDSKVWFLPKKHRDSLLCMKLVHIVWWHLRTFLICLKTRSDKPAFLVKWIFWGPWQIVVSRTK